MQPLHMLCHHVQLCLTLWQHNRLYCLVSNQEFPESHGFPTFALSPLFSRPNCLPDKVAAMQGVIVAIENQANRYYGLQYHPEVKHTERGMETLKHFLFGIAKLSADWKLENILEEELEKLRQQVGQQLHCCISFWKVTGWLCQCVVQHHTIHHGCLI